MRVTSKIKHMIMLCHEKLISSFVYITTFLTFLVGFFVAWPLIVYKPRMQVYTVFDFFVSVCLGFVSALCIMCFVWLWFQWTLSDSYISCFVLIYFIVCAVYGILASRILIDVHIDAERREYRSRFFP